MPEYRVNMHMPDGDYELRISAINQPEFRHKLLAFLRQLGTAPAVMQNIDDALARQPMQPHIRNFAINVTALPPVNGNIAPVGDDLVLIRNTMVQLFNVRRDVATVDAILKMLGKIKAKYELKLAQQKTTAELTASNFENEMNGMIEQRNNLQVEIRAVRTELLDCQAKLQEEHRRLNELRQELLDKEKVWTKRKKELEEQLDRLNPQVAQLNEQNRALEVALTECRNNRDRTSSNPLTI